jgi:HlyD family secretion protein
VDAYPGQVFHGFVAQIRKAPINVQNVITYDVVVDVSNPDLRLFPGMTANVTIFTGHVSNALRIPKSALRFRPRPDTVYALDEHGQPKALRIKTGISDANHVEALSGLFEGEQLITGLAAKSQGSGAGSSAPGSSGAGTKKLGF